MAAYVKEVLVPLMIAILGSAVGSVLFVICKSLWKSLMHRPSNEVLLFLFIGITSAAVASVLVCLCVLLRKKMMERYGQASPMSPRTAGDESANRTLADDSNAAPDVEIGTMNGDDEAVDNPSGLAENRGVPEYDVTNYGETPLLGRTEEEMVSLQNGTVIPGEREPCAPISAIKDRSVSLLINPTHQRLRNANPAELEMQTLNAGEEVVPTRPTPA